MRYFGIVQVLEAAQHLRHLRTNRVLVKLLDLLERGRQRGVHELQDNIDVRVRLNGVQYAHNVGVIQLAPNVRLTLFKYKSNI